MIRPENIAIAEFDYALPDDRIALYPVAVRDQSRLLVYQQEGIREDVFQHIPAYLPGDSLIIFNNSRVVEARLLFRKPTGALIEIFCLEPGPEQGDISAALTNRGSVLWKCLVGNAAAWTPGLTLEKQFSAGQLLQAVMVEKQEDGFLVQLSWTPGELSFAELLHETGIIPLPPYIRRKVENEDVERYQTIYAHSPGSVAAPTAGLHFTHRVLDELARRGIRRNFITLHVGAGTFMPVKTPTMHDHDMHAEHIEVSAGLIANLLHKKGPLVAVGTTSMRALESLYWAGVKLLEHPGLPTTTLQVAQWEPYNNKNDCPVPVADALTALMRFIERSGSEQLLISTRLLIVPSYSFRLVDVLITNFHQPRSTLLLLVAAFIGDDWKRVYTYGLANGFRFLSYGDSCLLFRK